MNDRPAQYDTLRTILFILGGLVAFMWFVELFDAVAPVQLDSYGIRPRTLEGLRNVAFAPFLHVGFGHLLANTVPFLILGFLVLMQGLRRFLIVTASIIIIGGLGTWLIGPTNSVHLGASILIFGYLGYLLLNGVFERSPRSIAVAVFVLLIYGSTDFGIFPGRMGVSWQGHLFGFFGGIFAAWYVNRHSAESNDEFEITILDQ
ncbi:MAG: rhomboid family intramembrane serine protease [Anaerolineae bacterium]|nr:rhomboid family intramembrane serine protease [Anaerolineae bacterium]MCO5188407.1 rhomboid family intramembrane serine protease [Anaerolineae bacterium]MCO5198436.1 rhomboid family intramembrane serine protease [Anaerolineae bacterium]